jgi:hypothetical protein
MSFDRHSEIAVPAAPCVNLLLENTLSTLFSINEALDTLERSVYVEATDTAPNSLKAGPPQNRPSSMVGRASATAELSNTVFSRLSHLMDRLG